MDDVLLVEEFERQASLFDYLNRLLFSERNPVKRIVKILSLEVLLNDEEVLSVLEDVVHADNIGVAGVHEHTELVNE